MQPKHFLYSAALILVAAGTTAAAPVADRLVPMLENMAFQDYEMLYGRIIAERRLGNPNDQGLVQQVQSQSTIDRFRDGSADPVAVVRVELLDQDGSSKARSKEGNYSYYVLRETSKGLTLLGRMYGSVYRSVVTSGKREFFVDLHPAAGVTTAMHYRIEGERLVNLSPVNLSPLPPSPYDNAIASAAGAGSIRSNAPSSSSVSR
jgi:hypothetical protein